MTRFAGGLSPYCTYYTLVNEDICCEQNGAYFYARYVKVLGYSRRVLVVELGSECLDKFLS